MTNPATPNQRYRELLAAAVAMEKVEKTLSTTCSNYMDIDPAEESAFTEIWKRLTDLEQSLRKRCHGPTPEARRYIGEKTGFIEIPMASSAELISGKGTPQWHKAREVTPVKDITFSGRLADGTECGTFVLTPQVKTTCSRITAVKSLVSSDPAVELPENMQPVVETRRTEGFELMQYCAPHERGWRWKNGEPVSLPQFGVEKADMVMASDDALAPEITKGSAVFIDVGITSYQGDGCYVFDIGRPGGGDIAFLEKLEDGRWRYTSYKTKPEILDTVENRPILGKAFLFLTKTESACGSVRINC